MWLRSTLLVAVATSATFAQPPAVSAKDLYAGARMRLEVPRSARGRLIGRFSAVDSQFVTITIGERGSTITLPLSDVSATYLSLGRPVARRGRNGGLVGVALGVIAYSTLIDDARRADRTLGVIFLPPVNQYAVLMLSAVILPPTGAVVGMLTTQEAWRPVALPRATGETRDPRLHLVEGDFVRGIAGGRRIAGMMTDVATDSITLGWSPASTRLALADVHALEIRDGLNRPIGAARGAGIGTLLAFAASLAAGGDKASVLFLSILGGAAGGGLGWQLAPTNWNAVPGGARW